MIEQDVLVQTKYGKQASFAVCPDGPGAFPGVILYMDAPGIREELRNMARRIAKHGYFCLLPDLYYRLGTLRFVAAHLPRIKAAASLYGVNIVTDKPDSPHLLLDRIEKRAVLCLCGSRSVGSGKRRLRVASCAGKDADQASTRGFP